MPAITLEEVLRARKIVVCCGSGGVGKTTCAAALGLAAARRGRRVLVCTIDPAKRLANSLGLAELGNEEREVAPELIRAGGVEVAPGGSLWAMMLDTKRTFDRLIEKYAPTPEHARRILENHIYVKFSGQLAGSQEYMSMEKLHELYTSGKYELIILDTPPTKHALDFLSAPKRLSEFLEGSVIKWFVMPYFKAGKWSLGLVQAIAKKALDMLDQLFGLEMLKELSEFFQAFDALWGGFRERAEKVNELLRRADLSAFVIVTSPTRETVSEAQFFIDKLREGQMPIAGVIANRVHTDFLDGGGLASGPVAAGSATIEQGALREAARSEERMGWLEAAADETYAGDPAALRAVRKAVENFCEFQTLSHADRAHLAPLESGAREAGLFVREIPAFERDVHDVATLARLDGWLLEGAHAQAR
ncbi:MAG TPA: ArsA-related P-loop ATPase [Planctomycetota bacterium]|nr:ArsA-related P-loop ATPase [Planctomycetota bacterium]